MATPRSSSPSLAGPIALSLALQLPLAMFLGHAYDTPLFMASGYLASHGLNPYIPADLGVVFGGKAFRSTTSIGYPPPWIFVCAIAYRLAAAVSQGGSAGSPNVIVYNLFLKLPLVAANLALALIVGRIVREIGADSARSRRATVAMLFNPLLLVATAAWGQIDGVAILCGLASLVALSRRRVLVSAIALGLGLSIKPILLPLLPLVTLAAARISAGHAQSFSLRSVLGYLALFAATVLVLCVLPFIAFGWDPGVILRGWNAHFVVAGGMSFLSPFELLGNGYALRPELSFLGFLWLPGLLLACLAMGPPSLELASLLRAALGLELVFFLCRAWVSEPNLVALLPLVAALGAAGILEPRVKTWTWIIPLSFALLNYSLPQLFFLVLPGVGSWLAELDSSIHVGRIIARSLLVVPWQILGWRLAAACLGRGSPAAAAPIEALPRGGAA